MKLDGKQSENYKLKIKVKDFEDINNDHALHDLQIGHAPKTCFEECS